MRYRGLGRTGMMISEMVSGGDPITSLNYRHLDVALDMGLNYFDMAPAYSNGDCELGYGHFLRNEGRRERVFLQTKVSDYKGLRHRLYQEIFERLRGSEREEVVRRVAEIRRTNSAEKPGSYLTYFPGQYGEYAGSYLSSAMMPKYGEQVETRSELRRCIVDSVDGSLRRLQTDHVDVLLCPHGANTPDEIENPLIYDAFAELKQAGKVRFLGVSSHNDAAGVLKRAVELGYFEVAMIAYNFVNARYVDGAIRDAFQQGVGMIGMKVAHAVATHHKAMPPIPQWRVDKLNGLVEGDAKAPLKAYVWALRNARIAGVISNLWDESYVRENLGAIRLREDGGSDPDDSLCI